MPRPPQRDHSLRHVRTVPLALLLLCVAAAVAASALAAGPKASDPPGNTSPARPGRILWGAWIGQHLTGTEAPWDLGAARAFERSVGKGVSLINFSSPFADCRTGRCVYYDFPRQAFDNVRQYGAIPFFSFGSDVRPISYRGNFQLSNVINGDHDAYLRRFATAVRNWGHPFFLRFNWEMNGRWFPWSEGVAGSQPGDYVRAWRHVHDVFDSVGATNATWVWCPYVDVTGRMTPLESVYPGDAYVDWTCLDGYTGPKVWRSFDAVFKRTYDLITTEIAPSKPMVIGEVGATESGGDKAAWIEDAFGQKIPRRYDRVKAVLWFDKREGRRDWNVDSSPASASAFSNAVSLPVFAANEFANLPSGKVTPLP